MQTPLDYVLAAAVLICATALVMTVINLRVYRPPQSPAEVGPAELGPAELGGPGWAESAALVTVAIPARNEEANIAAIVDSLRAQTHAHLEILVYDDHSTDQTAAILAILAASDPRVRAAEVRVLATGWNGKQFACDQLGRQARGDWVLFTDADVRFDPACIAVSLAEARRMNVDLLSTFPRQITGSFAEAAVVPMIFFILFSYLPMPRMRATADPATSAGCGQFLFAKRDAYLKSGGHAAFQSSMHDGIKMPRAFRKAGLRTDLFDATNLCSVRMYRGFQQTWRGFTKNAYEGLGNIALLLFITVMHLVGHVLPPIALAAWFWLDEASPITLALAAAAVVIALAQRIMLARRFRHSALSVAIHPLGVLLMTIIQWASWFLHITGRRSWRGRVQGHATVGFTA